MGLFSKKPKKTGVELLQDKSNNIKNVFTKTITDLQEVNEDIAENVDEMQVTKLQLEKDIESLNQLRSGNEKVIFNIQKIME